MDNLITLIIIVHNRHSNVERLLKYYEGFSSSLIIADSSEKKYVYVNSSPDLKHIYTPGLSFTEKINHVLQYVQTPYVAMCADDDFIIPAAISKCIGFLESHKDYSVTQGTCLMYKKTDNYRNGVEFGLLYKLKTYDIEQAKPISRLEQMFLNYRSVLYAVHRTEILKASFRNAGDVVKNLFLNEYLTVFYPIISGKYKELPLLYQVREFSDFSDDKITDNIDTLFASKKHEKELEAFVSLIAEQISNTLLLDEELVRNKIRILLSKFSKSPAIGKTPVKKSVKKRIGTVAAAIPVIGKWMINKNRKIEIASNLKKAVRTGGEKEALLKIENLLKSYP
jgi:glycosyltransferase domain-containing protein